MMAPTHAADPGLRATGLRAVLGGRPILSEVDFTAAAGEITCLVGKNGEGKTTLLRILCGIAKAQSGSVFFEGRELSKVAQRERARLIGALFSAPDTTFGFTVRELVAMGRYPHVGRAFESDADRESTEQALVDLELESLSEAPIHTLSAGERQRVGIARLLCQNPRVYLFDEPTSNLDPAHVERFVSVARGLSRRGAAVVCVVHDLDLALRLADRVVVLHEGRVFGEGAADAVLTPDLVRAVWGIDTVRFDTPSGRSALVVEGRVG